MFSMNSCQGRIKFGGTCTLLWTGALVRRRPAFLLLLAGADSVLADRRLVIAVLGLVVILPLCFPRELGALSWVSAAAVRLPETAACVWVLVMTWQARKVEGCMFMRALQKVCC